MSSPATYWRCSAKSMDAPKNGARCRPLMNPSTTDLASSSRLPMRARIRGSTNRAPAISPRESCAISDAYRGQGSEPLLLLHSRRRHWNPFQQLVDDLIGRDAFRFGAEVDEHAVPHDRMGYGFNVVEAHVIS